MAKWMIDPGHGAHDSGVMAYANKNSEKAMNLTVGLELARILKEHGQDVYMTRTTDKFLALKERATLANSKGVDYFISVHHNGFNGKATGMEVIYSLKTDPKLAQMVLDTVADGMGQTKRKAYSKKGNHGGDYYAVLRLTNMKAIITEFGFIDNPKDYSLVDTKEKLHKQAALIAKAVLTYAGKVYKGPKVTNIGNKVEEVIDKAKDNITSKVMVKKTKGAMDKLMEIAHSRVGKNKYSQEQSKRLKAGSGTSDCSGFIWWAYKTALNIDPGAYSGAQCLKGVRVTDMHKLDLSKLKPGDILFYERDNAIKSGRPYGIGHVELYVGDGKMIGHGSGIGPVVKPVTANRFVMARRYFEEEEGAPVMAPKVEQKALFDTKAKKSKYFSDVPLNHWAIDAIDKAKDLGLINGRGDGKLGFREDKAEVIVMMLSMRDNILKEVEKKYGK